MINCFVLFAEFFSAYKLEKKNARGGKGGRVQEGSLENTSPFCSKHGLDSIILSPFRVHHNSLIVF